MSTSLPLVSPPPPARPLRPALRVRGLSVTFPPRDGAVAPVPAVTDVDLDVARGELVALLGESGSGKSLTARAVMGLAPDTARVDARELLLGDTDLLTLGADARRRVRGSRMSLVFQDALSALNPVLTVGDQIGALYRTHTGASRRAAHRQVVEMLGLVGIPAPERRSGDYPHQFSGGMRQRVMIAMALSLNPEVVIADEPTTALDVTVQAQILELIDRLRRELGMAVLLITHDLGVVSEVADHVAVMYAGRIVERGSADQLLTRPAHPYTEALMRSVPQTAGLGKDLLTIPGAPPSPTRLPPGCAFSPRCRWVVDQCTEVRPPLAEVRSGRVAACHRRQEVVDA